MVAAVNGKVYSIEQNAQTGTTLTMELGNGYQAVYGQLTDLTVSEGDTIKRNDDRIYCTAYKILQHRRNQSLFCNEKGWRTNRSD